MRYLSLPKALAVGAAGAFLFGRLSKLDRSRHPSLQLLKNSDVLLEGVDVLVIDYIPLCFRP